MAAWGFEDLKFYLADIVYAHVRLFTLIEWLMWGGGLPPWGPRRFPGLGVRRGRRYLCVAWPRPRPLPPRVRCRSRGISRFPPVPVYPVQRLLVRAWAVHCTARSRVSHWVALCLFPHHLDGGSLRRNFPRFPPVRWDQVVLRYLCIIYARIRNPPSSRRRVAGPWAHQGRSAWQGGRGLLCSSTAAFAGAMAPLRQSGSGCGRGTSTSGTCALALSPPLSSPAGTPSRLAAVRALFSVMMKLER